MDNYGDPLAKMLTDSGGPGGGSGIGSGMGTGIGSGSGGGLGQVLAAAPAEAHSVRARVVSDIRHVLTALIQNILKKLARRSTKVRLSSRPL